MNKSEKILEVCVDSLASAVAAYEGGADRLELCQNLIIGGTTPDPFFYEAVRKAVPLPIHVLIRPRFGDFCYAEEELDRMQNNILFFQKEGAEGVVCGVLLPDGSLDQEAICHLFQNSKETLHKTLHRAFDMCKDPFAALRTAEELGFHTILTSGQKNNVREGAELLRKLEGTSKKIQIMAGGGVNADTIRELYPMTKIRSWHMSGKVGLDSPMIYRNPSVSMGIGRISEYTLYQTSKEAVREAKQVLMAE